MYESASHYSDDTPCLSSCTPLLDAIFGSLAPGMITHWVAGSSDIPDDNRDALNKLKYVRAFSINYFVYCKT
jgi:hypothetical protein